jgi:hypothetical protein
MDELSIIQIIVSNFLFKIELKLDETTQKSSEVHKVLLIVNEKEKNKIAFIG